MKRFSLRKPDYVCPACGGVNGFHTPGCHRGRGDDGR